MMSASNYIYTIKKNPRARHVKLKITKHGLELVVPLRFNEKHIPTILEENKTWIEKNYPIVQEKLAKRDELPTEIILHALQETWKIEYMQYDCRSIRLIKRPHQELVLFGNVENKTLSKKILLRWLRKQAIAHLLPWLQELSDKTQLSFSEASIRSQQTRWGSCTVTKNINLNDRLLFLPSSLVTHTMIHELCHTKHLNHSARFWKLVAKFDPNYEEHRRLLRHCHHYIPSWV